MTLLTIDYCMTCHDQTEHCDGRCSPCYKRERVSVELKRLRTELIEDEKWSELTIEQKVDFLYELMRRRPGQ